MTTVPFEPASELLDHLPGAGGHAWVASGDGLVAGGEAVRVDAGTGAQRFARAAAALREVAARATVDDRVGVPGTGLVAFGSFTFDPRSPGSVLIVPEVVVGRRGPVGWLTTVDGAAPLEPSPASAAVPERVRYAGSSVPDLLWLEAVAAAIARIDAGELDKVVLARDHAVWARTPFDPRVVTHRLAARFPSCFTFAIDGLLGATPELLVRRAGGDIASLVLAGSARRDPDPRADRALGEQLLGSKKDRREHELAVESVRAILGGLCADLAVDAEPSLLRLDNVQHLATAVAGTLDAPATALELVAALHPTAAVGGVPTDTAIAVIRTLEGMDRGRYSGPVGWTSADGDGEWGIALRCAELSGARARLFAGAGIVAGSLPEAELEETRVKLLAMRGALGAPTAML